MAHLGKTNDNFCLECGRAWDLHACPPEPWKVISEPRDTGDRWGIWPLLILIAVCLGGVAFGRWVQ